MPQPVFTRAPAQSGRSSFASAPSHAKKISRCFLAPIHACAPDCVIAYMYNTVLAFEFFFLPFCWAEGKSWSCCTGQLSFHWVLETALLILFRETTAQQHCLMFMVLIFAHEMCYVLFCGTLEEQHGLTAYSLFWFWQLQNCVVL